MQNQKMRCNGRDATGETRSIALLHFAFAFLHFAFCISHYAFFYFITPIVSALQSSAGRSTEGFTPVSRALWP